MACYDCEDCFKHQDCGGKCNRWEYSCPFSHLNGLNEDDQKKIDEDIKIAVEFKGELDRLINNYKGKFNNEDNYSEIWSQLKFALTNLEDMIDEDLIKEWNEINIKDNSELDKKKKIMKFRFKGEDKEYKVSLQKKNKDGTNTLFSNDYGCGIIGVILDEDDIEIVWR